LIVTTAYAEVSKLLHANMDALKALAAGLIANETLGSSEIDAILQTTLANGLSVALQDTDQ
jgi:ATP-dependent Zn protease